MENLKRYFITSNSSEYIEGEVNHFSQVCQLENRISKASLVITALGIYEAEINGSKVGNQIFAPGFTYYPKDLFYQEYDVTDLLKAGTNTLDVYLAQGWYSGRFTHENITQIYGDKTAVSWMLSVHFEDGSQDIITSSDSVVEKVSQYQYAGFYDGEIRDDRIDPVIIGEAVKYTGSIPEHLSLTQSKVILQEKIPIKEVIRQPDRTIIDFGQNFAGIIELNTKYLNFGETIHIRHGEVLTENGQLYTDNLRKAKAEIIYTSDGNEKKYRPRFTYMGFRYIEISGVEYKDGLVEARALYNDMCRTGYFNTSHEKLQRVYENQLWGQKSNYVEVPTDCPQRDERMGYTGDGQAFARTGAYNFDSEDFWKKFFKDIAFSQADNSENYVAPTIPANGPGGIGFLNMLGWGNAVTIIPEAMYQQFGSEDLQVQFYDNMKAFIDCEIAHLGKNNLWLAPNLGDWLMPDKDMAWMATNNGPVSNSFIVNDLNIFSKLAKRLGFEEDYLYYREKYEQVQKAYISTFVSADGTVVGDYQGAYIMVLQYVLEPGALRNKVAKKFVENVRENGINTGFFSTEYLLPLLVENGEPELAYDLLLQEDCPGWIYQVNRGATTIWERWDAIKPDGSINDDKVMQSDGNMVSFNHYAFGSVGRFIYEYILGIKPLVPGFKKVQIKPIMDSRLGHVSGSYHSRNGKISVEWILNEDGTGHLTVDTPVDSLIELPNGMTQQVMAGIYKYTF